MNKVIVSGPSPEGLKGGQVTHLSNIQQAFKHSKDLQVKFFYSSSGFEDTENKLAKSLRLIRTICAFPFALSGYDIVHINSSFDSKALIRDGFLCFISLLFNKKLVVQYHGGDPLKEVMMKMSLMRRLYVHIWKRSQVLVLNESQFNWLTEEVGVTPTTVKNYVNLPTQIRANKKETFKFVFIGRVIKEKGLFEIVEAAHLIREQFDFEVQIFGNGEDVQELEHFVKVKRLSDTVKLCGTVDGNEKERAYLDADAFLYPSYAEALPYSVLEAMSYGLPLICTDVGALKGMLTHNVDCLKVDMKSSRHLSELMLMLLSDEAIRDKLSQNARYLIETQYSNEAMETEFKRIWCES